MLNNSQENHFPETIATSVQYNPLDASPAPDSAQFKPADSTIPTVVRDSILLLGLDWLKYTGIWSITALAWTFAVCRMMHLPYDPIVLGIVGLLTFISYNYDHLLNHAAVDDQINTKQRSEWISAHRQPLQIMLWGATLCNAMLLTLRPAGFIPVAVITGLTVGYNLYSIRGRYSIRQIPGLKAFYVGFGSMLCTVGVPLMIANVALTRQATLIAIAFFCFYAAISNVLDIRDLAGDRLVGTQTLPVLVGEKGARWISGALLGISAVCAVFSGHFSLLVVAVYLGIFAFTYQLPMSRSTKILRNLLGLLSLISVIWIG
jgi:4-hydroxybenzoate polyprenyltransferase